MPDNDAVTGCRMSVSFEPVDLVHFRAMTMDQRKAWRRQCHHSILEVLDHAEVAKWDVVDLQVLPNETIEDAMRRTAATLLPLADVGNRVKVLPEGQPHYNIHDNVRCCTQLYTLELDGSTWQTGPEGALVRLRMNVEQVFTDEDRPRTGASARTSGVRT